MPNLNLKSMRANELYNLREEITKELEKRENEEYMAYLEDFKNALYNLYSNYPDKTYLVDDYKTWEELYEDNNWNF